MSSADRAFQASVTDRRLYDDPNPGCSIARRNPEISMMDPKVEARLAPRLLNVAHLCIILRHLGVHVDRGSDIVINCNGINSRGGV